MSRNPKKANAAADRQPDLFAFADQGAVALSAPRVDVRVDHTPGELSVALGYHAGGKPECNGQKPAPRQIIERRQHHLMDVRAAAAWLGLSKSTLDKMRCYGTGPRYIRATCRAVRYDPDDLRAFAEARRERSSGEA